MAVPMAAIQSVFSAVVFAYTISQSSGVTNLKALRRCHWPYGGDAGSAGRGCDAGRTGLPHHFSCAVSGMSTSQSVTNGYAAVAQTVRGLSSCTWTKRSLSRMKRCVYRPDAIPECCARCSLQARTVHECRVARAARSQASGSAQVGVHERAVLAGAIDAPIGMHQALLQGRVFIPVSRGPLCANAGARMRRTYATRRQQRPVRSDRLPCTRAACRPTDHSSWWWPS